MRPPNRHIVCLMRVNLFKFNPRARRPAICVCGCVRVLCVRDTKETEKKLDDINNFTDDYDLELFNFYVKFDLVSSRVFVWWRPENCQFVN